MVLERRRSQFAEVAGILLLVGTVLHALGALFLALFTAFMFMVRAAEPGEAPALSLVILMIYVVLTVLTIAGFAFGLSAWHAAQDGHLRSAGVRGIIAALLPPVAVILLLGGIFAMISDEAKMEDRGEFVMPNEARIDQMVIRED